jgi:small subunit ribosomal protein S1
VVKKVKKPAMPAGRRAKSSTKTSVKKVSKKSKAKKEPQTMDELLAQTGYQPRGLSRGETIEGTVTEKTKRALFIDFGGKSEGIVVEKELKLAQDLIEKIEVGDKIKAVVYQAENDQGQILLSLRKEALEKRWRDFEEKLKTGETVKVVGHDVNRGGLVVEVSGTQGFIPASQFGSKYAGKIEELIGKTLKVKPIEVNREKNRLIFSEKEVSEAKVMAAQAKALKGIKIGDSFDGVVTGVMPFGLFIKIKTKDDTELEGLVHISEISWEKVDNPADHYKERDEVKVKVLAIDKKSGRLNLSIKQLTDDPWAGVKKKYKVEARVKGKVVRLAPFGAFVNLEPGIDGLIHISKIPAEKSLKVGDQVNCYIESIDPEARRMSLGLVLKEKPVGYK